MSFTRTIEERIRMVRLYSKFENAHEVRRQWKDEFDTNAPTAATILSVNQKFDEKGTVEDLKEGGHPITTLTEEKLEEIQAMVSKSPQLSIRQGAVEVGISKSSYHSAMKQLGFKPYHPTLIVDLNEDDFDRRSEFCEIWLEKFKDNPYLIDRIFWSDEANFNLKRSVNRHNCTYWARENPHLKISVPNTKEGVTVWCGMSSNGLVGPYFFEDVVTGQSYKRMLVDYAWPKLKKEDFYFQQDGAGPHYALLVREWLDGKFPGRWIGRRGPFDWPARSPDLTPCDFFLWGYLKDLVYQEPPVTIMELQEKIEVACEQVTNELCRKVCRSVERRLYDCLEREGQFVSY